MRASVLGRSRFTGLTTVPVLSKFPVHVLVNSKLKEENINNKYCLLL